MPKNITIYTTNTCSYCVMVKRYLASKNMSYEEVNLDETPERAEEAFSLSGGRTVPVTVVTKEDDTRSVITGWNPSLLIPAVS